MPVIVRYYDAEKNPDGASIDGAPLADISEEQFAEFPEWLQASVDATPFYRKTKPRTEKPEAEPKTDAKTKPAAPSSATTQE